MKDIISMIMIIVSILLLVVSILGLMHQEWLVAKGISLNTLVILILLGVYGLGFGLAIWAYDKTDW